MKTLEIYFYMGIIVIFAMTLTNVINENAITKCKINNSQDTCEYAINK